MEYKAIRTTRWEELQDSVNFHLRIAVSLGYPTICKFINNPSNNPSNKIGTQHFTVGDSRKTVEHDMQRAQEIMQAVSPNGETPLTTHILEIVTSVSSMLPALKKTGKKICVVIATDGVPTDDLMNQNNNFHQAIKSLGKLPVWIIFRLSTNDKSVLDYYNSLDTEVECPVDVIDDFVNESKQVKKHNSWINYCLPLQRCRELGYNHRVLDFIDERRLTGAEARKFCQILFGSIKGLPNPEVDFRTFAELIKMELDKEYLQWDVINKKMKPWIDLKRMKKAYGRNLKEDCCVM